MWSPPPSQIHMKVDLNANLDEKVKPAGKLRKALKEFNNMNKK